MARHIGWSFWRKVDAISSSWTFLLLWYIHLSLFLYILLPITVHFSYITMHLFSHWYILIKESIFLLSEQWPPLLFVCNAYLAQTDHKRNSVTISSNKFGFVRNMYELWSYCSDWKWQSPVIQIIGVWRHCQSSDLTWTSFKTCTRVNEGKLINAK